MIAILLPLFGYLGVMLCAELGTAPQASATPNPGEPGGNHSKPGDNKKKKKDSSNKNRSSGSDRNNNPGSTSSNQWPSTSPSRIGDGRLTTDGPNRTVQITGSPGNPQQRTPTHQQAPAPQPQVSPASTPPPPPPAPTNTAPQNAPAPSTTAPQPVTVTAPTNGAPSNDTTGAVVLGTAALAGALSRRYTGSRTITPENLGDLLGVQTPAQQAPQQAVTPLNPSTADLGVLREVMINDGVPTAQLDQQIDTVVSGAQALNTHIATGTLPPVPQTPIQPQPAPGFADGFRDTWNGSVQGINNLFGLGGPKAPGVLESWEGTAQGLNATLTNSVGSTVEQFANAPSAAYFFGQNTAQLAQQAPLAILGGPELAAARVTALDGLVPETSAASFLRTPFTGSYLAPTGLGDQMALQAVHANPGLGTIIVRDMGDARWPAASGWVKMQQVTYGIDGKIAVHYVFNTLTGAVADAKFVVNFLPPKPLG